MAQSSLIGSASDLEHDTVHKSNKSYRRYAAHLEKTLSSFDGTTQEWADYVSFLSRLLKAVESHPPGVAIIPHKRLLARRLARCLEPRLPSGVHQKALEVYHAVFSVIGKDGLATDFGLYLTGLASFLNYASLSVRPRFLDIIETYVVVLDSVVLRPALKALVLMLLPALEETSGDESELAMQLLGELRSRTSPVTSDHASRSLEPAGAFFWQSFFLASISGSNRGIGTLTWLTKELPHFGNPSSTERSGRGNSASIARNIELSTSLQAVFHPEPGLLIRCFIMGLRHDHILVQRGFLELLVTHLPLHTKVLHDIVTPQDLHLLVSAAILVVLRRDVSLNRRLWSWMSGDTSRGPEMQLKESDIDRLAVPTDDGSASDKTSPKSRYFEQYGIRLLIEVIMQMMNIDARYRPSELVRALRICSALMDEADIARLVIPRIFIPLMRSTCWTLSSALETLEFQDLIRSSRSFIDAVDTAVIWEALQRLSLPKTGDASDQPFEKLHDLRLALWLLGQLDLSELEAVEKYAPALLYTNLTSLRHSLDEHEPREIRTGKVPEDAALGTRLEIIRMLSAHLNHQSYDMGHLASQDIDWGSKSDSHDLNELTSILLTSSTLDLEVQAVYARPLVIQQLAVLTKKGLDATLRILIHQDHFSELLKSASEIYTAMLRILPSTLLEATTDGMLPPLEKLVSQDERRLPPTTLLSVCKIVLSIMTNTVLLGDDINPLIRKITLHIYASLGPERPQHHVELVRSLIRIQSALSDTNRTINKALDEALGSGEKDGLGGISRSDGTRFAVIWTHLSSYEPSEDSISTNSKKLGRRPIQENGSTVTLCSAILSRSAMRILGSLDKDASDPSSFTRDWLQNLTRPERLLEIIFQGIVQVQPSSTNLTNIDASSTIDLVSFVTVASVLRWAPGHFWTAMVSSQVMISDHTSVQASSVAVHSGQTYQLALVTICLEVLKWHTTSRPPHSSPLADNLTRTALLILLELLQGPYSDRLARFELERECLTKLTGVHLKTLNPSLQIHLLSVTFAALKLRILQVAHHSTDSEQRRGSHETTRSTKTIDLNVEENNSFPTVPALPLAQLLQALRSGLSAPEARVVMKHWVQFLVDCLPLFGREVYQALIPLTELLCREIGDALSGLQQAFTGSDGMQTPANDQAILSLLEGLEQLLATAHDQLVADELKRTALKSPDQRQGFFGSMFSTELSNTRPLTANDRLTVVLSFHDAVKTCYIIWMSGATKGLAEFNADFSRLSLKHSMHRLRSRARRILDHLFAVERLEALEALMEIWAAAQEDQATKKRSHNPVCSLLHVLDGSQPNHTLPAIFRSLYTRTNPSALESSEASSMTVNLQSDDIVAFLLTYITTLDDDVVDEIWADSLTFLRDVLASPAPHRTILPGLLRYVSILSEKLGNTTFGEQKRYRKELADIFLRQLSVVMTGIPSSALQNSHRASAVIGKPGTEVDRTNDEHLARVVTALSLVVPRFDEILSEEDRISSAVALICEKLIGPTLRNKSFPDNISLPFLSLVLKLANVSPTAKAWRKEVTDAFSDSRFFDTDVSLILLGWAPILRQWTMVESKIPEIINRLPIPTSGGLFSGSGPLVARTEADRKAHLNLGRLTLLILASDADAFVPVLATLQERLVQLLGASTATTPSAATRPDIYLLFRALLLKTRSSHLRIWTTLDQELRSGLLAFAYPESTDSYSGIAIWQLCKLLDLLVAQGSDEFQPYQWMFIEDSIEAVHHAPRHQPVSLLERISEEILPGTISNMTASAQIDLTPPKSDTEDGRRPLLAGQHLTDQSHPSQIDQTIRRFMKQLSIWAFEQNYRLLELNKQTCLDDLIQDLFPGGSSNTT